MEGGVALFFIFMTPENSVCLYISQGYIWLLLSHYLVPSESLTKLIKVCEPLESLESGSTPLLAVSQLSCVLLAADSESVESPESVLLH